MGLDYRVVILFLAAEEPRFYARLQQAGTMVELPAPFGTCVTLDFPLDDVMRAYLARGLTEEVQRQPGRDARLRQRAHAAYFPTEATGRVGCWYLATFRPAGSDAVYVPLTAATTRMSRLLQQSPAIRYWFVDLCRDVHATAAFLDLEAEGYEFFCRAGQAMSVTVDEEGHAGSDLRAPALLPLRVLHRPMESLRRRLAPLVAPARSQGRRPDQLVEAINCSLLHRCGALVRKSCSFSKSLAMHNARIRIGIDYHNRTLKQTAADSFVIDF